MGVRQRENLSLLLFSLFLNDLHSFLKSSQGNLQMVHNLADDVEENIEMFLKLYLLLYANDAVLLAESPGDLQRSICAMKEYCDLWKLNVNVVKTKVVIFSRGKTRKIPKFELGENELEVVIHNKYLGLTFNFNGKFTTAQNKLYEKVNRAMFALLRKSRQWHLPIDVQLHLFDALVEPVLLYGCEVWPMRP